MNESIVQEVSRDENIRDMSTAEALLAIGNQDELKELDDTEEMEEDVPFDPYILNAVKASIPSNKYTL